MPQLPRSRPTRTRVQIQDGGNFDPTKKGFSSISFGGRFGRTARIEVDGLDISDETVGTTTQNIPVNSIKEFQVSQVQLGSVDGAYLLGHGKYHHALWYQPASRRRIL